ncbi:acetaldehyde dehydrogenase (acetylating) [Rothia uropygialis]|uniref:acetaldehyde dehydrogenase (acetylating) n=1 Tax=Kocuria sp. 36 TaxID=1415402 RepID=UPI001874F15E|nr:acetaldehyde dehydrogenase (acetylating) [Kocuria sp. 36]
MEETVNLRKPTAAIVGPGNIGTDLLIKLKRRGIFDVLYMIGVDPSSAGLERARKLGVTASAEGVDWMLKQDVLPDVVFEATTAGAHAANAPRYAEAGIQAIDLTPAAVGPFVSPAVNLQEHLGAPNINMITCGGQATIPIVAAVHEVTDVPYAEIIASISSRSAGPGTRANIDEFTETTSQAIESVGGAQRGKAIIVLNPVDPPLVMRDTVFVAIDPDADRNAITKAIYQKVSTVQEYVPGYKLKAEPQFDDPQEAWNGQARVGVFLEITGNGDFLPEWAGNLDIMTAAANRTAEEIVLAKTAKEAVA